MPLIHCIYASGAVPGCTDADIQALVRDSQERNARRGVTGMLVCADRSFFQVLEGEAEVVDALYETIARDPRHRKVTLIIREPIARRAFPNWSMGFLSMTTGDFARLMRPRATARGRLPFDHPWSTWLAAVDDGRAKKLLAAFAGGRWRARQVARASLRGRVSHAA